jgi:hypothetical protein
MDRLRTTIQVLRILTRTHDPNRVPLIEDAIHKYVGTDIAASLERLRKAIDHEETAQRKDEDWTMAKEYVRSMLQRLSRQ